ncbi:MAG: 5-oxoprolinase [Alphaproteobacteria bacterium]|jgi:N-methylhydantoinase A|nr:5-oxoprolinase [Alphaproteobacteria bacterium]PPR13098.1 MAG: Acetophenone carboxylase gamma subunit [Alphaproteobacteria bacterium MarineAlpha12_Bin1]|tara:strand:+ start:896 stop:2974 length:2079 start_codon:yes stop_codon:yes gene_type:complete
MRFAVDTGGTFTDLIVEEDDGKLRMFKAATTPDDPIRGLMNTLESAALEYKIDLGELLSKGDLFIHGTTHAINAIVTGNTAKTAFLSTEGHRDILVFREGGRMEPFNFTVPFPEPYLPRALTFEVPGRILADGSEMTPLDEEKVIQIIDLLKEEQVESVAVCLLWSIVNSDHELRVGELLQKHLPDIPFTLSHALNPSLREYRRASSAAIDASLKPLMSEYMNNLNGRLRGAGFKGRVLIVTSQAGVMDAEDIADSPIHLINSGPSMAPVSGRYFAKVDEEFDSAVVTDTGGTTYDVSLVRKGGIPWTRETWIGEPYRGHMTGFPSVEVKSIGAGGGSIAWVDEGGMLHVGPQSAGAVPGPACYRQGGEKATVTDASLVLGHIDPVFFLGGEMELDLNSSKKVILEDVANPMGLTLEEASAAIISVATENMVQAIVDITVNQGIDPRETVLIGGGGAAGLNAVAIARRLGCYRAIIPEVGAALSAAGAMMSELTYQFRRTHFTTSEGFDYQGVNHLLENLRHSCNEFIENTGKGAIESKVEYFAEARYPEQVWEIEVPISSPNFENINDINKLVNEFHKTHEDLFAINDPESGIEIVGWTASVKCRIRDKEGGSLVSVNSQDMIEKEREAYFVNQGFLMSQVKRFESLELGEAVVGPAIIESPFTTVVIDPGAKAYRKVSGSLSIDPGVSYE